MNVYHFLGMSFCPFLPSTPHHYGGGQGHMPSCLDVIPPFTPFHWLAPFIKAVL